MSLIPKLLAKVVASRRQDEPAPHKSADSRGAYSIPENRDLSADERTLIQWLIENGVPEARTYAQQMDDLHVVGHCSCGCHTLDLSVADAHASTTEPSHILADFIGLTPDNVQVGVILHARQGKISELEIYPLGETTASLPKIESLKALE